MTVNLMEANPLVEETRNQVAVKRGPIVYCLESPDLKAGESIADIAIPAAANWTFQPEKNLLEIQKNQKTSRVKKVQKNKR